MFLKCILLVYVLPRFRSIKNYFESKTEYLCNVELYLLILVEQVASVEQMPLSVL